MGVSDQWQKYNLGRGVTIYSILYSSKNFIWIILRIVQIATINLILKLDVWIKMIEISYLDWC